MVPVAELRKGVVEHFAPQASLWGERVWFGDNFVSVLPVSLGGITKNVSMDSVGAIVWTGVFGGCSDSSLHCGSLISLLEWFRFLLVFARSVVV